MGKIRRVRQKLHQSVSSNKLDESKDTSYDNQLVGKSPLLKTAEELAAVPDNLFEGIDINFDDLKTKLEDDMVSVKSIAKSCKYDSKGKLLTKKEKMKLKHDIFMRKINTVAQLKKEALQKHKKRKGLRKPDEQLDTLISPLPVGLEVGSSKDITDGGAETREKKTKKHCFIKKAKVRQREMLQEISTFQKILTDPNFSKDPFAAISESVRKKVTKEMKEDIQRKRKERKN